MANKTKLIKHVQFLCDKLNEVGIKDKFDDEEYDWSVDESSPDMYFLGGICQNAKALQFIKDKGYINMGICPFCGEEPITNRYSFTSSLNRNITFYVCKSCKTQGEKNSIHHPRNKTNCYIATACYGSLYAPEVIKFREYRDTVLLKSFLGMLFIRIYHVLSPTIAQWLKKKTNINRLIKEIILDKIYHQLLKQS